MARIVLGLGAPPGPQLQLLLENIAKLEWGEAQIFAICEQAKKLAYIHVELERDGGGILTRGLEPSPARTESTEPNAADGSIDWVRALKHWGSPSVTREPLATFGTAGLHGGVGIPEPTESIPTIS